MTNATAERFLEAHGTESRAVGDDLELIASRLAQVVAEATAAWPGLHVPDDELVTHLGHKIPAGTPWEEGLRALNVADLYLTVGCARGDPAALAAFDGAFGGDLRAAHHRMGARAPAFEDFHQTLRQKLFVDDPPRIASYGGAGSLRSWLRVTALRTLLDMTRAKSAGEIPAEQEEMQQLPAAADDPELGYFKHHYRDAFRKAFEEAANALDAESRNVLREHFVHGLGIDQIAFSHGIHRATAARRLARAREDLLRDTRRRLIVSLSVSREELASVMRLIESQLHVSVERLLRTQPKDS